MMYLNESEERNSSNRHFGEMIGNSSLRQHNKAGQEPKTSRCGQTMECNKNTTRREWTSSLAGLSIHSVFRLIYKQRGDKSDRSTDNNCKSIRCLCFIRSGYPNTQDGQAKLGQKRRYAIGCATDAQERIDLPCNQRRM